MCMSEVEGIRLRMESALRERLRLEEDRCRLAASPEQCQDRKSQYIPLYEATRRIDEVLAETNLHYKQEIADTVGELEGDLSDRVLSSSQTLFSRTLADSKESYLASYRKYFQDWTRCLVKVGAGLR